MEFKFDPYDFIQAVEDCKTSPNIPDLLKFSNIKLNFKMSAFFLDTFTLVNEIIEDFLGLLSEINFKKFHLIEDKNGALVVKQADDFKAAMEDPTFAEGLSYHFIAITGLGKDGQETDFSRF